ncbi:MAG: hypothetical protein VXW22_02285 [Pseudomonadota bacterium]|nr:hypothetical protein [Pseudomonadota bacterium]
MNIVKLSDPHLAILKDMVRNHPDLAADARQAINMALMTAEKEEGGMDLPEIEEGAICEACQ